MNLLNPLIEKEKFKFTFDEEQTKIYQNLNPEEKELIDNIKNYIEKHSFKWKIVEDFEFIIPPSIFEFATEIKIPDIYQNKSKKTEYASNISIGAKFTPEILKQIWENGKFDVESKQKDLPYTWKLSKIAVKGINNIISTYKNRITDSFNSIYSIKYNFSTDFRYYNFYSSFYHLYLTVYNLLNILIGMPMYSEDLDRLKTEIKRDNLNKFVDANPNIEYKLFNANYNGEIKEIDNLFYKKWKNEISPEKIKIYKSQKLDKATINVNLQKDKKIEFRKFLNKSEDFKKIKIKYPKIEEYLESYQIIIDEKFKRDEEFNQKIEAYEKELEKHNILKLCTYWYNEKKEEYNSKLEKELDKKLTRTVKEKIKDKKEPSLIYSFNKDSEEQMPEKIKKLKEEKKKKRDLSSKYTFDAKRVIIKPYEVKKDSDHYYYIEKYKYYYVKTDFFLWKVWLFIIKLFCTFFNLNVKTYRFMTSSSFGIKALFLTELYQDVYVDPNTGALVECSESYTFPKLMRNLLKMIRISREKFESSTDTGILGKGFTRIFNLIINYVFKLLILGSLLIVFYPLLIVVNVIICLWIILLSPIIAPFWNLLDYLFSVLIFNRYGSFFFEIFKLVFKTFLFSSIFQFIFCCIIIIFKQLFFLILIIVAHIYFITRYCYDLVFFYIIKFLGKIPFTDSFIAWRISGPHLFRERFYDISNKDLMSLVIAQIERMVLYNYYDKMTTILESPEKSFNDKIQNLLNLLNIDAEFDDDIEESINYYKNILSEQIKKAKNNYPYLMNPSKIKFSEERLNTVKNLIQSYLISYTSKNDLSFELDKYKDHKIEKLTEKILTNIFGNRILETLDDTDKIVHLESVFHNSLDEISQRLFENPEFDDRVYIEERKKEKNEVIKEKLPGMACFKDLLWISPLILCLDYLDGNKWHKIFNKID